MSGSAMVDVVIGIALMYLVLSLLCTAVQEWIAQISGWRQRHLANSILYLLDDSKTKNNAVAKQQAEEVLQHPLVKLLTTNSYTIFSSWNQKPAYITARNFALTIIDVLRTPRTNGQVTVADLSTAVGSTGNQALKEALEPIVAMAGDDLGKAVAGIEAWYDSAMDRASGWYKRQVRWMLLLLGLALGYATNADPIQVAMHLAADDQLRTKVATLAAATAPPDAEADSAVRKLSEELERDLGERELLAGFGDLPVGWAVCGGTWRSWEAARCYPGDVGGWATAYKLAGLLLTALAVSLGAPFWFGLLQQFNAARSAGPRPATASTRTAAQP